MQLSFDAQEFCDDTFGAGDITTSLIKEDKLIEAESISIEELNPFLTELGVEKQPSPGLRHSASKDDLRLEESPEI